MYLLMKVLAKEAATVRMRAAMLKQGHSLRLQRNNYIQLNTKLFHLWETYNNKTISSQVLLQKCAIAYSCFNALKFKPCPDDYRMCELE